MQVAVLEGVLEFSFGQITGRQAIINRKIFLDLSKVFTRLLHISLSQSRLERLKRNPLISYSAHVKNRDEIIRFLSYTFSG